MVGPVNVMDVRSRAREALAPGPWGYLSRGAEDRVTLKENRRAFRRIHFGPWRAPLPRDRVEWRTRTP